MRTLQTILRFARDKRGVSAVEFAIVLPFMIALYFGGAEFSQAIGIDRKVTLVTKVMADLTAQTSKPTATDVTNILNAGATVVTPYDSSKLKITLSCITIDAAKVARVQWSETRNGTARGSTPPNNTIAIPSGIAIENSALILSEVSYTHTPVVGYILSGTITLADKMYMRPRLSDNCTRG